MCMFLLTLGSATSNMEILRTIFTIMMVKLHTMHGMKKSIMPTRSKRSLGKMRWILRWQKWILLLICLMNMETLVTVTTVVATIVQLPAVHTILILQM